MLGQPLRRRVVEVGGRCEHRGVGRPGRDHHRREPGADQVGGEPPHDADDGVLAGDVRGELDEPALAGRGGDRDEAALARGRPGEHDRHGDRRGVPRALDVDVEQGLEVLVGRLPLGEPTDDDARSRDDGVEPAEPHERGVDRRLECLAVAHVALDRHHLLGMRLGQPVELLAVGHRVADARRHQPAAADVEGGHRPPLAAELCHGRRADAAGGAGDQRDAAGTRARAGRRWSGHRAQSTAAASARRARPPFCARRRGRAMLGPCDVRRRVCAGRGAPRTSSAYDLRSWPTAAAATRTPSTPSRPT